jgi:Ni/Co efflux regulator RcnB
MKKLLSILLLATITATAYADKNAKANKVKQPQPKPQMEQPNDTAWHGTGKEGHYESSLVEASASSSNVEASRFRYNPCCSRCSAASPGTE